MRAIVLENENWYWKGFETFATSIDPQFEKFNPDVRDAWYAHNKSIWLSMGLSQPNITDVIMESNFQSTAFDGEVKHQIEFYLPIIREVLRFREIKYLPPLTFHVVYIGDNFMANLQNGEMGVTTHSMLSLILRQQNNIIIKLYDSETFKLQETIVGRSS